MHGNGNTSAGCVKNGRRRCEAGVCKQSLTSILGCRSRINPKGEEGRSSGGVPVYMMLVYGSIQYHTNETENVSKLCRLDPEGSGYEKIK